MLRSVLVDAHQHSSPRSFAVPNTVQVHLTIKIWKVVVTRDDVWELAERLWQTYSLASSIGNDASLEVLVLTADGAQYESSDLTLLEEGGVLDRRTPTGIDIEYRDPSQKRRITISLRRQHLWGIGHSEARVTGTDETWVRGTAACIDEHVRRWKKQTDWPRRYRTVLTAGIAAAFGILFARAVQLAIAYAIMLQLIPNPPELPDALRSLALVISYLSGFALMLGPATSIVSRIQALYPPVELAMGPEHLRAENAKRTQLRRLMLWVVVPLVIGLVVECIIRLASSSPWL